MHTASIDPLVPYSLARSKTSDYITDNPRLLWVLLQSAFDVYNREFCDDFAVPKNTGPVRRAEAIVRSLVLCLMLCVNGVMGDDDTPLGIYGSDDTNGSALNFEPLLAQRLQHWLSEAVQYNLLAQSAALQAARAGPGTGKLVVDLRCAAELCRYFLKSMGDDVSESWRDDKLLQGHPGEISFHLAYEKKSAEYEKCQKLCQELGQLGNGGGFNAALVRQQRLEFAAVVCQNLFRAARARRANRCATILQALCRRHLARSSFKRNIATQEQSHKHGAGILQWTNRYQAVADNVFADITFCFCCGTVLKDEWTCDGHPHLFHHMHFPNHQAFKEYTKWYETTVCPVLALLEHYQEDILVSKGVLAELLDAAAKRGANSRANTTLQQLMSRADNLETKLRGLEARISRALDKIDADTEWTAKALRHMVQTAFPPLEADYELFKVHVDAKRSDPQRAKGEGDREVFRSTNRFAALMNDDDSDDDEDDVRRSEDEELAAAEREETEIEHGLWATEHDAEFDDSEGWETVQSTSRKARKSAKRKGGGGGGGRSGGRDNRGNTGNKSKQGGRGRGRGRARASGGQKARNGRADAGATATAAVAVRGAVADAATGATRQRHSGGDGGGAAAAAASGHRAPVGVGGKGRMSGARAGKPPRKQGRRGR